MCSVSEESCFDAFGVIILSHKSDPWAHGRPHRSLSNEFSTEGVWAAKPYHLFYV